MKSALSVAEELYSDRSLRARALKAQGSQIVNYFCSLTPIEIITAAGLIPYRIFGSRQDSTTLANEYLEVLACPFTRSALDMALKGEYSFSSGLVVPHACDNIVKIYDIWAHNIPHAYAHFINVPHTLSPSSFRFLEAEFAVFRISLERYVGHRISDEEIVQAIQVHNTQRKLVRQLYDLRKFRVPQISATEMIKVMLAVVSMPVAEGNELLRQTLNEIGGRPVGGNRKGGRLMIAGTDNNGTAFVEAIEQLGAHVVVDDLCFGTKPYFYDVEITLDPLIGLARAYLDKVNCPRTFRHNPTKFEEDLETRFGYIYRLAAEFGVEGIILYRLIYCDTHAFDTPDLKEYLEGKGLPVMVTEEDYPTTSIGRLRTKVQAFLEMAGN